MEHCPEHIEMKKLIEDIQGLASDMKAVKDALLGTYDKAGFITRLCNVETEVAQIKELKKKIFNIGLAFIGQLLISIGGIIMMLITHKISITW